MNWQTDAAEWKRTEALNLDQRCGHRQPHCSGVLQLTPIPPFVSASPKPSTPGFSQYSCVPTNPHVHCDPSLCKMHTKTRSNYPLGFVNIYNIGTDPTPSARRSHVLQFTPHPPTLPLFPHPSRPCETAYRKTPPDGNHKTRPTFLKDSPGEYDQKPVVVGACVRVSRAVITPQSRIAIRSTGDASVLTQRRAFLASSTPPTCISGCITPFNDNSSGRIWPTPCEYFTRHPSSVRNVYDDTGFNLDAMVVDLMVEVEKKTVAKRSCCAAPVTAGTGRGHVGCAA
ncbi:hypothetical protein CPB84DRAFT_1853719 [Gymnopilus junonius]|uniref:Uncharacterized protein n=1 Tax=Gymnopilus junonius TaxID=109634 RepID=A0A9P5NBM8_GYMJU|nr:hypothetical protein CPB84DRAFT_1853719 [Gymnopilus junonius]